MNQELQAKITQRNEIIEKIKERLIENLNIPYTFNEIHPDTFLFGTGLGLDSIDALEIAVFVEKEFGYTIENSDIAAIRTINSLTERILENNAYQGSSI